MILTSAILIIAEVIGFIFGIYAIWWLVSYPYRKKKAKQIEEQNKKILKDTMMLGGKIYNENGDVIADFTKKNGKKEGE